MAETVLDLIRRHLDGLGLAYREIHHEPTPTSEESARARGESLAVGGKALVLKVDDELGLFVFSAARKLDSGAVRRHFGARGTRFATREELLERTGLVPGSVPPFGPPILPLPLYADPSTLENEKIAFNAGSLTTTVIMAAEDYRRVCGARWLAFSQPFS